MEKYCPSCRRVLGDVDFKLCPYCGTHLKERVGRKPIPGHLRHLVFQRDGYRCVECGATNRETTLEIDHIIPVSKGGTNDISNLQTLCKACNRAKHATIWEIVDQDPIKLKEEQLKKLRKKESDLKNNLLSYSLSDDDRVNWEYQLRITQEKINGLEQELGQLRSQKLKDDIRRQEQENKKVLYKKLYLYDDDLLDILFIKLDLLVHTGKEDSLKSILKWHDEKEINDALENAKTDLILYNRLRKNYSDKSIGILERLFMCLEVPYRFYRYDDKFKYLASKYAERHIKKVFDYCKQEYYGSKSQYSSSLRRWQRDKDFNPSIHKEVFYWSSLPYSEKVRRIDNIYNHTFFNEIATKRGWVNSDGNVVFEVNCNCSFIFGSSSNNYFKECCRLLGYEADGSQRNKDKFKIWEKQNISKFSYSKLEEKVTNSSGYGHNLKSGYVTKFINCPNCGKRINSVALDIHHKCPHCEYEFKSRNKRRYMDCPSCGKKISSDFKHLSKKCPYCGHKFKGDNKKKKHNIVEKTPVIEEKETHAEEKTPIVIQDYSYKDYVVYMECPSCGKNVSTTALAIHRKCTHCGNSSGFEKRQPFIKCPKCSGTISYDYIKKHHRCFHCGYDFNVEDRKENPSKKDSGNRKFCPKCNCENDSENNFCTNCGTEFVDSIKIDIQ